MEAPIASMIMTQQIEIVSLRKQLDECKKDAERYHWLRNGNNMLDGMVLPDDEELDKQIDKAMGE